jgi:hypothetical protein
MRPFQARAFCGQALRRLHLFYELLQRHLRRSFCPADDTAACRKTAAPMLWPSAGVASDSDAQYFLSRPSWRSAFSASRIGFDHGRVGRKCKPPASICRTIRGCALASASAATQRPDVARIPSAPRNFFCRSASARRPAPGAGTTLSDVNSLFLPAWIADSFTSCGGSS